MQSLITRSTFNLPFLDLGLGKANQKGQDLESPGQGDAVDVKEAHAWSSM